MKSKFSTRNLVFAGLLIGLEMIFTRFVQIPLPSFLVSKDRISLGFLPVAVGGMLYGPFWGGAIAALADIIRALVWPQGGAINPLFVITAGLRGVLYGVFLYKKPSTARILIVSAIIFVFVNVFLNSAFTAFSYGGTLLSRIATKIWPALVNLVLQVLILPAALPRLGRSL